VEYDAQPYKLVIPKVRKASERFRRGPQHARVSRDGVVVSERVGLRDLVRYQCSKENCPLPILGRRFAHTLITTLPSGRSNWKTRAARPLKYHLLSA
jgi:hypothetical protein